MYNGVCPSIQAADVPPQSETVAAVVSRSNRRHLQTTLFLGSILLILAPWWRPCACWRRRRGRRRSRGSVVISEFMAAEQSMLVDEDGEAQDWIELHNRRLAGRQPVRLVADR